jgi:hypothetical protein
MTRLSSLFIVTATCCLACSAPSGSHKALLSTTEASEIGCPNADGNLPQITADSGEPLWLQSFGETPITGIASDRRGNVILTRGDVETRKLDGAGTPRWSRPFGSLVAIGPNDSVFVAGTFEGALPVSTTTTLQSSGGRAVYVVRLDSEGNVEYAISLGGSADGALRGLAVDSAGNAAVSGEGIGTVKLDEAGKAAWSRDFFGHVAFDADGNLLLAGELRATTDFGGGPLSSRGGSDVLVAKLDADGQHIFSRSFGDVGQQQRAESITVDAAGSALIAGVFDGSVDFGTSALTLDTGSCSSDAWCNTFGFVAELDEHGQVSFSVGLGPMRTLPAAASDSRGNYVVSGALPGGVRPFRNSLALALDGNGVELWRRAEWPETGIGSGHALAIDPSDDVLWAVTARPNFESGEHSYVAKLSP